MPNGRSRNRRKGPAIRSGDSLVTANTAPSKVKIISIILAILVAISFCILVWLLEGKTILDNVKSPNSVINISDNQL